MAKATWELVAARNRVIAEQAREIVRLRTELDRAFAIAAEALGSEFRNIGVVQALADHCRWLREQRGAAGPG